MERLSVSSRKPTFAGLCTLPTGDYAVNVWDLLDCHKCFVSHSLEDQLHPLCVDIHPVGYEVLVSFGSKLQIFVVLQDVLCLAFEIQQKQISIVQYSQTGSMFAGVHSTNKMIYVYLSFTRHQREPQLVGIYRDFRDSISVFMWSLHDSSFFGADASGELRHCRLRSHCGGEVEDFIVTESSCRIQAKGDAITSLKTWKLDRDSHDFVLFGVERLVGTGSGGHRAKPPSCYIRAWINGDLTRDAIKDPGSPGQLGESIPHDVTVLGVGCSNLLFAGTASGAVLILAWKISKRSHDGHQGIRILPQIRRVDLHTSPVCGLFFVKTTRTLLTNATSGVVLACSLRHEEDAGLSATDALRVPISDDDYVDSTTTFSGISQADEVALYDRSKIDLRKLKVMDLESELQQLKLENEMLTRQIADQKEKYENKMKHEISSAAEEEEQKRVQLQAEMDARLHSISHERDVRLHGMSSDAQIAQDQYLKSLEKLQAQLDSARSRLEISESEVEDNKLAADERETELRKEYESRIDSMKRQYSATQTSLQSELEQTRKQLYEVLRQQDQDQLAQMSMLSTNIEEEKARAATQMTNVQGKVAGLHQELKMLLTALNEKDQEIQDITADSQEKANEIRFLKERLHDEHKTTEHVTKEKAECVRMSTELKHSYENLQRLNNVHRSQIELLQKQLLPKDREIEQMQQYMNQLHEANQDIVVQANLSDRLRNESASKAKKFEKDVASSQKQLEKIRHSIVVLQEELGELVKLSAVQEKSAIIGEVVRIHKRLTRQLDILQAKDDSSEEITAELHRQNGFLLKNKQHLRHQMEIANKEKHKLVSALSFQNGTLMTELNALKKLNKELERKAKRLEERDRERSHETRANTGEGGTHPDRFGIAEVAYGNQEDPSTIIGASSRVSASSTSVPSSTPAVSKMRPKSAGAASTRRPLATGNRARVMM